MVSTTTTLSWIDNAYYFILHVKEYKLKPIKDANCQII